MLFFIISLIPFLHDYHVSVADVVYNEESNAIQISYRMFFDDLELALREESGDEKLNITADEDLVNRANESYFRKNLQIKVNGQPADFEYLGHEMEGDGIWSYIEISGINKVSSIEIKNMLLLDIYDDQQNMVHFKIAGDKKSFILNENEKTARYKAE